MRLGCSLGLPPIILPLLFPSFCDDASVHWAKRYTTKANLWLAIYSFVANYVWTHYFYTILHCRYTFPAHRLNDVPIALYLITHSYFLLYHVVATRLIRFVSLRVSSSTLALGSVVLTFSYLTAFLETFSIQSFPYYNYPDPFSMFTVGSLFYAIYFIVSFPMFYRLDENLEGQNWTVTRVAVDSLGACMIVTLLLDFWRIAIGPVAVVGHEAVAPLPWMASAP
ncbi:Bifunctional protein GlmU [Thoreauomyces humboldtii]|nr:Bifunctional protein GlmU [Thoreauomyces humboldtii]